MVMTGLDRWVLRHQFASAMLTVSTDSLEQLGWPRILAAVSSRAASTLSASHPDEFGFLADLDTVRRTLTEVDALMVLASASDGTPPLDGVSDIRSLLERVARGGTLSVEGLYDVARTTRAMTKVRRYFVHNQRAHACFESIVQALPDTQLLADELHGTFDDSGEIRSDASPELSSARKRLTQLRVALKKRLEEYIARREIADWLQDDYYTLRDERYVIPIMSSFQGKIEGIIHGASNTGQTVYVEPTEFIEANNDLTVAAGRVDAAILAVLTERTEWIRAEHEDLRTGLKTLVRVDGLVARARFAADIDATVPTVSVDGAVELNGARNPLLALTGTVVIENDIALMENEAFLVVTGPNTGGKTVTLNTLGTLTLMTWAGIPIPAAPDSRVVLFDAVHALIGDAQDIHQHLSTFSGHVEGLKRVLDASTEGALVLLDEIAVGTEPAQGAALAIAVLESLANRGARGVVTTHYERLKTLPFEDPRFANASVGVREETLEPTFVLHYGEPGSSTPLEVAARLGLPASIIARARDVVGGNSGLTAALDRLSEARRDSEAAAAELRSAQQRMDTETHRLKQVRERLMQRADDEVQEMRSDARQQVQRGLKRLREALKDLTSVRDAKELQRRMHELSQTKSELQTLVDNEPPSPAPSPKPNPKGPFDAGDLESDEVVAGLDVFVRTLAKAGRILELRGNKDAQVAIGGLKLMMKRRDLGRLGMPETKKASKTVAAPKRRSLQGRGNARLVDAEAEPLTPPPRTDGITSDLRGMRVDEVADTLVGALDHAYYDNVEALWVIHGHGTGALKREVRNLVRQSPYVAMWRPGLRHEGGDGVTIAWLHRD